MIGIPASSGEKAAFDAVYVAHPSSLDVPTWGRLRVPTSIAASEHDNAFPAATRHAVEAELAAASLKSVEEGGKVLPWQVVLYSGVKHGFAVRGDLKDPLLRFARDSAAVQAVRWFEAFL